MRAIQLHSEVIVDALQLACRAPSLHNSQPWRWVTTDHTVQLFADPTRLVRSTDPTGRETLISCGAVLGHFRVARAAAGSATSVLRFPDPDDPLHLATVEFTPATVSDAHRSRADAILARRTDRLPLAAPPDPDRLADSLSQVGAAGTVCVDTIPDESRSSLAEASQLTEALRLYDSDYHSELSWWTADFVTSDGIPPSSLVSAPESDRVDVGRTFPVFSRPERRREIDDDQSTILVLSTVDDSRVNVLRCGEELSAILLNATIEGMSTCTLTHVTEIPAGRDIVASLIPGDGVPQVLIRVGVAPPLDAAPPPTPRRPIDQVVQTPRDGTC